MTGEEVEPPYLFGTEGNQVVMTLRMSWRANRGQGAFQA
jgi:hypothetical protein